MSGGILTEQAGEIHIIGAEWGERASVDVLSSGI